MRVLPTIRRRRFLLLSVIVLSVIVFLFPNVSAFHIIIDSNPTPGLTPILFDLGENIVTSATFTATTTTTGHAEIRLLEEVSRAIVDSCVGSEVSLAAGDSTSLSCTFPNNVAAILPGDYRIDFAFFSPGESVDVGRKITVTSIAPADATLTVTKQVINDGDGTAIVSDFSLSVENSQGTVSAVTSGVPVSLDPDTYTVGELGPSDYIISFSVDCEFGLVTLATDDVKTCIITNDDLPQSTLTVDPQQTTTVSVVCCTGAGGTGTAAGSMSGASGFGSVVVMTLVTPSGITIDMNDSNVTYLSGPTFELYIIKNPEVGLWQFEFFGEDVTEDELITLNVTFDADSDADGILDVDDNCPLLSGIVEDIDRDANDDGCPDTAEELLEEIEEADLPKGVKNSLIKKIKGVIKSYDRGKNNAGNNTLEGFIDEVEAQQGKKIPADLADLFIAKANNIIALHP